MVSEVICLDIVRALYGRVSKMTRTFNLDSPEGPKTEESEKRNALSDSDLVRPLVARYSLTDIDAAIRWLRLGSYIGETRWGLGGPWVHVLTEKGMAVAQKDRFPEQERRLFYPQVEPYQVFFAHQFLQKDEKLANYIRNDVLSPAGYSIVDGKADGLEEFRQAILSKIRNSFFFLCLLSHRIRLESGYFASSVWLYQEIGAAIAFGKLPLLLVEDGMDTHFAGELQKTYEYIPFNRDNYREAFVVIARRFDVELERHAMPLPAR